MNTEWQWIKCEDFMLFNPTEKLSKGTRGKKVSMDKITPHTKEISSYDIEEYNGGTKFKNGDTLMARITPCLENGKISQVNFLDEEEIGFGSTEFIVLREKEGVSDKEFIYYLSQYYPFKNTAISSMIGSSGRQRVQNDVLKSLELKLPTLDIQQKIGKILSQIDDKIELNNKINNNLKLLSNNIFRQYFISYEFPDEEEKPYKSNNGNFIKTEYGDIPEHWNIIKLKDICKFIKGKKPKVIEDNYFEDSEEYLTIDVLQGNDKLYGSKEKTIPIDKYDILMVMDGASSGDLFYGKNGILGSTLAKIQVKKEYLEIIYKYLDYYNEEIKRNNTGSAIPHTDKDFVLNLEIAVPSDLTKINKIFRSIRDETIKNNQEIDKLTKLRDTLLPKLMSGEIDVSSINFDLE